MRSNESDWTRAYHQSVQRSVRQNRDATLRHVRVHPVNGPAPSLYSDWGHSPTRRDYLPRHVHRFPEGLVVVSSPERPFFRAIWGYEECYGDDGEVDWSELTLETSAWESGHNGRIGRGCSTGWWGMSNLRYAIHRMVGDLRGV